MTSSQTERGRSALRLGLVGLGVGHSRSPDLHAAGLRALGLAGRYDPFEAATPECALGVIEALRRGEIDGLNVTTPYKGLAASLLGDAVDPVARHSANTLWMCDGRLQGGSSDGPGLLLALAAVGVDVRGLRIGVLGAGGVAAAVSSSFAAAGARVEWIVARDQEARRRVAAACGAVPLPWAETNLPPVDLCLQATRIGHGARDSLALAAHEMEAIAVLAPSLWRLEALFVDLVVARQRETPWQRHALDAGLPRRLRLGRGVLPQSGAAMLAAQAAISLGWWTDSVPPLQAMARAIGVDWFDTDAPRTNETPPR